MEGISETASDDGGSEDELISAVGDEISEDTAEDIAEDIAEDT
jgi:hypothetical protein